MSANHFYLDVSLLPLIEEQNPICLPCSSNPLWDSSFVPLESAVTAKHLEVSILDRTLGPVDCSSTKSLLTSSQQHIPLHDTP